MPSSLNRREFLKDMGLLGVGAGLTTLGPVAAFEESWGDTPGNPKRPSWVHTVDQPTVEIDWDSIYRFDERNTVRRGWAKYVGDEAEYERLNALRASAGADRCNNGELGYTVRDLALYDASGIGATQSFLGPDSVKTPAERGVAAWDGTPEDNAAMIRAALRAFGAATVGFVELDDRTEKLIYGIDPDGKELVFVDDDVAQETETQRLIPRAARWVITWTVQMSGEQMTRCPTPLGAATTSLAYARNRAIQSRLQGFLRGIGYYGLGEAQTNALGIAPAFGVLAGLGELSRLNRVVTPEYGPMARVFKMVTNLPLAPTKPIDAGIVNFCRACKTCATYCPSGSLSMETEPSYETQGGWNRGGVKTWYENSLTCRNYWAELGTNCGICFAVCPFSVRDRAAIHSMVKSVVGTTPIFDGALASLSRTAYVPNEIGQPQKDTVEWWNLDYAEYGHDSTRGHADA